VCALRWAPLMGGARSTRCNLDKGLKSAHRHADYPRSDPCPAQGRSKSLIGHAFTI
jgi:hypothetical protein